MELISVSYHPENAGKKFSALVSDNQKKTTGWGNTEEEAKAAGFHALKNPKK